MEIRHTVEELRQSVAAARNTGQRIALVPTMGNLHEGHITLVREALASGFWVVTTIFVNPMQFGADEDLDRYPRTLEADRGQLESAGCHCLFTPAAREIYPAGLEQHSRVHVPGVSRRHCGASRPGHFDGVATVVSTLFNIVLPDAAWFGRKDYQQLQVIRKMTTDLCFPVRIFGATTKREPDGLAMSSRNAYLSEEERDRAAIIYRTLRAIAQRIEAGEHNYRELEAEASAALSDAGLEPEYFNISEAETLEPAAGDESSLVILTAARLGKTRLIDNITIEP